MAVASEQINRTQTRPCQILVLGLGNILLRDEGIGIHVAQAMQQMDMPVGVEVLDGATAGLDLLDHLADRRKVVVVDAIDGDFPGGTVVRLTPDDLMPAEGQILSLHGLGLMEALRLSERLGAAPDEVVILGVKPANLEYGLELSAELGQLVPQIVQLVLDEVSEHMRDDQP
jgi:hydrogenase maturation protease